MTGSSGSLGTVVRVVQWATAVAVALFVVGLFVNPPSGSLVADDAGNDDAGGEASPAVVDGAAVFAGRCASCHGGTGGGGSGPPLDGGRMVEVYPDVEDQIAVVTDGRNGMPAFADRLSAAEIEAVVEHTRSL